MQEMLRYIDPNALPEFAKYLKQLLSEIHTKVVAAQEHEYRSDELRRHRQAMDLSAQRAFARIRRGQDRENSIIQACHETPFPPYATVDFLVKRLEKRHAERVRLQRNRRIVAMMQDGYSNKAIARAAGVSVSTVAKVLLKGEQK